MYLDLGLYAYLFCQVSIFVLIHDVPEVAFVVLLLGTVLSGESLIFEGLHIKLVLFVDCLIVQ